MIGTWPQIDDDSELARLRAHVAALEADKAALTTALYKLQSWGACFIEKSSISAETLWREFPIAMKEARATLAAHGTKP